VGRWKVWQRNGCKTAERLDAEGHDSWPGSDTVSSQE